VYVSQTLYHTINVLSVIFGVFFLIIGLQTRSPEFFYTGAATFTWSFVISAALIHELAASSFTYWRMSLYAATGMLIYFITMFSITHFHHALFARLKYTLLLYFNAGWIIYAVWGGAAEVWLDTIWTASSIGIYVGCVAWLIYRAIRTHHFERILPLVIYWLATSTLGIHDFIIQSGVLPFEMPEHSLPMWIYFLLQPIYLTQFALCVFIIMAMWLLIQDHLQKTRSELAHVQLMQEQREHIVSDIHDGVGSRINILLWSLRTEAPNATVIQNELLRCMEELRFAINPTEAGHETLHKALQALCNRLAPIAHAQGVELVYSRSSQVSQIASDIGLHLYKATQECVSNALRHSEATRITIDLFHKGQDVCLRIQDDGTGIRDWNDEMQKQIAGNTGSLGLLGLAKRMHSKGGHCVIHSNSEGTTVMLSIQESIASKHAPLLSHGRRRPIAQAKPIDSPEPAVH
jgi:signal transduction histidine kinase